MFFWKEVLITTSIEELNDSLNSLTKARIKYRYNTKETNFMERPARDELIYRVYVRRRNAAKAKELL